MGGLARRVSYIRAFQEKFSGVPQLYLDAGHLFADSGLGAPKMTVKASTPAGQAANQSAPEIPQLLPADMVRNEWMVRGYQQIHPTAVLNLTERDLPYLSRFLVSAETYQQKVNQMPLLGAFVSANLKPVHEGLATPRPYLIRELYGSRLQSPRGDGIWRVGVIGVSRPGTQLRSMGYEFTDPVAALRKVIPELRGQVDVLVVLAALEQGEVVKLAQQNPTVDVVIGNPGATSYYARTDQRPVVVMASYETKELGELRLYKDLDGRLAKLAHRSNPLDETVLDDPTAAEIVADARLSINTPQQ